MTTSIAGLHLEEEMGESLNRLKYFSSTSLFALNPKPYRLHKIKNAVRPHSPLKVGFIVVIAHPNTKMIEEIQMIFGIVDIEMDLIEIG